jgi:hypothetical protein
MTLPTLNNQHRNRFAVHFETTPGLVPVDGPAWAASTAGATGFEIAVEEAGPEYIRGDTAIPNADLQVRVFESQLPHKGLPEATGGAIVSRVWGSLESHSEGVQVAETGLGRMLEHALGGASRGNHSAVDVAGVLSTTQITLVTVTNLVVGQIIGIAAAADPLRIHPVQITAIASNDVTYDRELPFVVNDGDLIYGADCAYPEQAALTNPLDPNASTVSLYYQRGPDVWVAGGSHLAADSLGLELGQQPKITWSVHAARGYTPGNDAPAAATFTGSIEGLTDDTLAIGRDTRAFIQTAGVTTDNCTTVLSAAVTIGVPVLPVPAVTECNVGFPGLAGYRTEPGDTIFEIVVAMDAAEQTRWTTGALLTFTYLQIASVGAGWCIHAPVCYLMDSPEPVFEGTNQYTLRLKAKENPAGTTEIAKAKFVFARF